MFMFPELLTIGRIIIFFTKYPLPLINSFIFLQLQNTAVCFYSIGPFYSAALEDWKHLLTS